MQLGQTAANTTEANKTAANEIGANCVFFHNVLRDIPSSDPRNVPLNVCDLELRLQERQILQCNCRPQCHSQQLILANISGNIPSAAAVDAPDNILGTGHALPAAHHLLAKLSQLGFIDSVSLIGSWSSFIDWPLVWSIRLTHQTPRPTPLLEE